MKKQRKIRKAHIRAWVNKYFEDVNSVSGSSMSQRARGSRRTSRWVSTMSSNILKINSSLISDYLKEYLVDKFFDEVQKDRVRFVLKKYFGKIKCTT